ncbi:CAP domain-containing protein [Xanthocytophaga agilis]|uniref:CAP domain-containing protein n=1 Tax=Xanthocytophaga agilis TaxID=3048010 RepID=A0AAE3R827_9BACT|nr:CAP domain-containing protein [Xanthocytophaga agilis]MDJ1503125.1 CAP domain-containing protein [Xanthocytophaga agilis]
MFVANKMCIYSYLISGFVLTSFFMVGCQKEEKDVEDMRSMLTLVNTIRTAGCQCGSDWIPPAQELTWNDTLSIAADNHATDMSKREYFDHISPEGTSPIQRAQQVGYSGLYIGENIARGYSSMQRVIDDWKASESHCKTMMDTLYTEMGAGRSETYWVQEFGSR